MWPWGHLAVGYLIYRSIYRRQIPETAAILALALGTQLPDLIDKPLAWTIPLLPNGRSLGHSLVIALPVLVAIVWLADTRRRQVALAFALGYLAHLGSDALYPALRGEWSYVKFLGWPLVPPIEYTTESASIISHFLAFELTMTSGFEFILFSLAVALWFSDQKPGFEFVIRSARTVASIIY